MGNQIRARGSIPNGLENGPRKRRLGLLPQTMAAWPSLDLYQRFEQAAALVLTLIVSGVIVVSIAHLIVAEAGDLFFQPFAPVDHAVFQTIFGKIMTVLIALEFNHTIMGILHRNESVVQLKTVVLIALLAIARKFIIMDFSAVEPLTVIALGFAVLALGAVYWLVRDQDRRDAEDMAKSASAG